MSEDRIPSRGSRPRACFILIRLLLDKYLCLFSPLPTKDTRFPECYRAPTLASLSFIRDSRCWDVPRTPAAASLAKLSRPLPISRRTNPSLMVMRELFYGFSRKSTAICSSFVHLARSSPIVRGSPLRTSLYCIIAERYVAKLRWLHSSLLYMTGCRFDWLAFHNCFLRFALYETVFALRFLVTVSSFNAATGYFSILFKYASNRVRDSLSDIDETRARC